MSVSSPSRPFVATQRYVWSQAQIGNAEQKREPPARQGGSRRGLAKRRTTNKLFFCEIGPVP